MLFDLGVAYQADPIGNNALFQYRYVVLADNGIAVLY